MDERPRTPDWARLARAVKSRRQQLDLTQPELVAAGGPSVSLISRIESGKPGPYDGKSLRRLERALQWDDGSIDAVLNGGKPKPVNVDATISPITVTGRTEIPQPTVIAAGSQTKPPVSDAVMAQLEAMQRQQDKLLEEVRGLRRQVDDLQRQGQQDPGTPESRASA